jgi:prolyl 4-hydroxylase
MVESFFEIENSFKEEYCDELITISKEILEPTSIIGEPIEGYRVADGIFLPSSNSSESVSAFRSLASQLTKMPVSHQEDVHIVRYKTGGEYKGHYDFFQYAEDKSHMTKGGDRYFTVLTYLNDNFKGGRTVFPKKQVSVKPVKGKTIVWKNLFDNFQPDESSYHAGFPVTEGEKWIAIIWVRQYPYI